MRFQGWSRSARVGLVLLGLCAASATSSASSVADAGASERASGGHFCGLDEAPSAAQLDLQLRFTAFIREQLNGSGQDLALIARDGLDLARIGQRYSHAGLALRESPAGAWSVRQLYYACEDGRPRLFDQGLAGFLMGSRQAERGHVSVLLLPAEAARPLAAAALDDARALRFLHPHYSANAYAFGLRYQNCNQWVAELMAAAWGEAQTRAQAQDWLLRSDYHATLVRPRWRPTLWLATLSPWLHLADHPHEDLAQGQLRVSLPQGLMDWLQSRHPEARRLEFCHRPGLMVMREGGPPLSEDCQAEAGDLSRPL